ncbi:Trk-type K+ transport system, membrane component [Desulfitobacterium dehalogenans ATCC 51507]|uniref:Trk-type K+ transport system, membrane component n=1 Tax=Desulfitobacterium dehalogenans (strain ATCC 51507 / DSM 9161 / JW/IU-DC1) TaxID=756499 RepID=I4A9Q7_DESDJ|nr:TrkH family potassium uptake protein [Desulfitobacterium dehalogenans]AFM00692.1 Trk-type K+ transport system, membrane component [Desulfitobacterium dehalogenans ATCC 51507]
MNVPVILGLLGRLLIVYAGAMCIPLILAVFLGEWSIYSFLLAVIITGIPGLVLIRHAKADIKIGVREAFVAVAGAWILASLTGALPYWFANVVPTYIDAVFETVSGLTTTGASVINDVEVLPQSILLWRSLTHWLGGMGIIVLFIVLLPKTGMGSVLLFNAEVPGPMNDRVMPRIRDTATSLWKIYLIFTAICALLLWMAGMTFLDAINYAFATIATGGFSTKNTSIMYYDSLTIEMILTFFMILSGANFVIYLTVWRKKTMKAFRNTELIVYLLIITTATLAIAGSLWFNAGNSPGYSFRHALFQVATIITTTGYASADFDQWPSMTKIILLLLMFIGGSAGSTSGGMKVSRIILLVKATWAELKRGIHPRVVSSIKLDNKVIDAENLNKVGIFFFLYIVTFTGASIIIASTGLEPFDAMSAVAATLGNIGPGFGVVGPTTTFAGVSLLGKTVLTICMLLGRLEFFTLLIIFRPEFWRRRRVW